MKSIIFGFLISILLFGCAGYISQEAKSPYQIHTRVDEFDGFTIDATSPVSLSRGKGKMGMPWVNVKLQRYQKDSKVEFDLILHYISPEWLFIRDGESLVLLVDGERIGFSGEGSLNHRITEGFNNETASYSISTEQIKKISIATDVKAKLTGSDSFITREFKPDIFFVFQSFYNDFVKESSEEIKNEQE
ncbi:MAG: hypothetical protein HQ554_06305 [FCB group bacterium]|nr:hypothetical protein [FCB group bacterium]